MFKTNKTYTKLIVWTAVAGYIFAALLADPVFTNLNWVFILLTPICILGVIFSHSLIYRVVTILLTFLTIYLVYWSYQKSVWYDHAMARGYMKNGITIEELHAYNKEYPESAIDIPKSMLELQSRY